MNFLAHLYLSGPPGEVMTGNFMADSIRSSQLRLFTPGIQQGIRLHQAIDTFTDSHPLVEQSKARLRSRYHKYAGVITDVFYDHFLALNWAAYSETALDVYAQNTYAWLETQLQIMPPRASMFYAYMVRENALLLYRDVEGIKQVMKGMARRARFNSGMKTCTEELVEYYGVFSEEFKAFFPELINMCSAFPFEKS